MKENALAAKIRSLKKGQGFLVKTKSERERACRIVKTLRDCGYLPNEIITRKTDGGFSVLAI